MAKSILIACLLVLSAFAIMLLPQRAEAFLPFGGFMGGGRPRNPEDDLYGILGVSKSATQQEIKKAFRTVTREEHPDMKTTAEEKEKATERMRNVLRAYGILSDPEKRKQFDSYGVIAGENGAPNSPNAGRGGGPSGMPPDVPPEFAHFFRHFGGGGAFRVAPIESASPSLTLKDYVGTILPYRGRRLFLIQFYADRYSSCKLLSPVWEALYKSAMSQSEALRMYRVNIDTEEGVRVVSEILGKSAVYSMSVPTVVAVTDGVLWHARDLGDFLNSRSQQQLVMGALQGFVQSFYTDYEYELASGVKNVASLKAFLTAAVTDPLAKDHADSLRNVADVPPVRVLISSNGDADAAVAVAASIDDPKVEVKIVPRLADMVDLVTRVCQRNIGVPLDQLASLVLLMNETIIENAFDLDVSVNNVSPAATGDLRGNSKRAAAVRAQQQQQAVRPPTWCRNLFIAPLRTAWRPKVVLGFIRSSFTKDSEVISKKYPNAIPILRSPTDFNAYCSPPVRKPDQHQQQHHHDSKSFVNDVKGKYCALYVVNQCDGTKRAKGKGVSRTFMEPPLWAGNRDKLKPFELVGVCLDRQPRLLFTLTNGGTSGPRLASVLEREDFIMMYDYSEPSRVGVYTHSDIGRGGGLTAFGVVLAAFLEDNLSQQPHAAILQLAKGRALVDAFLTEPSHHVDVDNRAVYGRTITTHSLPPLTFPVAWYRWWAWRAVEFYKDLPMSSFVVVFFVFFLYRHLFATATASTKKNTERRNTTNQPRSTASSGTGGGANSSGATFNRNNQSATGAPRAGPQHQQQRTSAPRTAGAASPASPPSSPSPPQSPTTSAVVSIIPHLSLRSDLTGAGGGFLIVFISREGHSQRNATTALDELISRHRTVILSDSRFTFRQLTSPNSQEQPSLLNESLFLWQQWASILEKEAIDEAGGNATPDAVDASAPLASKCLYIMAIRAKKRLAAVKPLATPFDHWCEELADGSSVANKPLPRNFSL